MINKMNIVFDKGKSVIQIVEDFFNTPKMKINISIKRLKEEYEMHYR